MKTGPLIVTSPSLDDLLARAPEETPLSKADLKMIRDLDLSSCDFVGDSGCIDPDCWRCHSPLGPENLRQLAKNLVAAAMLCREWKLRGDDPNWWPGCNIETDSTRVKKRVEQHSEDVLQHMADLRMSVESLGRSIDGPGDRDAALDLAREVHVDIRALINRLHEYMEAS